MATKFDQFTLKIKTLQEYHQRILCQPQPHPTGVDIANTLKFFTQTLTNILKDIDRCPIDDKHLKANERARLALLPTLDYKGLYHALLNIMDVVPMLTFGQYALCQAIFLNLGCLICFLPWDILDSIPYTIASLLTVWPQSLHKETIDFMAFTLLPMVLGSCYYLENESYATSSIQTILMLVFQYSQSFSNYTLITECLMSLKKNISYDLLNLMGRAPLAIRAIAANLVFHYFQNYKPINIETGFVYAAWRSPKCMHPVCESKLPVTHSILTPLVGANFCDSPPPFYLCQSCYDDVILQYSDLTTRVLSLPLETLVKSCENPQCKSDDRRAVVTCFHSECTINHDCKPLRLCATCDNEVHASLKPHHQTQGPLPTPYDINNPKGQIVLTDAIMGMLIDANYEVVQKKKTDAHDISLQQNGEEDQDQFPFQDKRLLSRFAIWLLCTACQPKKDQQSNKEIIGRLLSSVFQWFDYTSVQRNDSIGVSLENLKNEVSEKWLQPMLNFHFDVFVSCLMPKPDEYARVGGYWDTLECRARQIRYGLHKVFCLTPYNVISLAVWNEVMPHWLNIITFEIPVEDLDELRVVLSKIFDLQMCTLSFSTSDIFTFVANCFKGTFASEQERALSWLQTLSFLNVVIPIDSLLNMFTDGLLSIKGQVMARCDEENLDMSWLTSHPLFVKDKYKVPLKFLEISKQAESSDDSSLFLSCFNLMLDVLLKQFELQEAAPHQGLDGRSVKLQLLLCHILSAPLVGEHECGSNDAEVCGFCSDLAFMFEMICLLLQHLCPPTESRHLGIDPDIFAQALAEAQVAMDGDQETAKAVKQPTDCLSPQVIDDQSSIQPGLLGLSSVDQNLVTFDPVLSDICVTAEQSLVIDNASADSKHTISSVRLIDNNREVLLEHGQVHYWETSKGFFKLDPDSFPVKLKLLYILIRYMDRFSEAQVRFSIVKSLRLMILNAECLNFKTLEHIGFFIYCQEKLLLPGLWSLVLPSQSRVVQQSVPLIIYCLSQPCGENVFWNILQKSFMSCQWEKRFEAIEKATAIFSCLDKKVVTAEHSMMSIFAFALCCAVDLVHDECPAVYTRTLIALKNVRKSSMKFLFQCLEYHFDYVVEDRTLILNRFELLHFYFPNFPSLTWNFFLSRFDTLSLESQVEMDQGRDSFFSTALAAFNASIVDYNDVMQRKLVRAQCARKKSHNLRSFASTFPENVIPLKHILNDLALDVTLVGATRSTYSRPANTVDSENIIDLNDAQPQETPSDKSDTNVDSKNCCTDRETVHLLISLLMKFMARPHSEVTVQDERQSGKAMNTLFRHLNVLLSFNQHDKSFNVPPHKLRSSVVFNAYISHLPTVLDYNNSIGGQLLNLTLYVLLYAPSPQRSASEWRKPDYSLWLLEPHVRHNWLMCLLIILYKYRLDGNNHNTLMINLIKVALHTLKNEVHQCQSMERPPSPVVSPTVSPSASRHNSKDYSNDPILEEEECYDLPPYHMKESMSSLADTPVKRRALSCSASNIVSQRYPCNTMVQVGNNGKVSVAVVEPSPTRRSFAPITAQTPISQMDDESSLNQCISLALNPQAEEVATKDDDEDLIELSSNKPLSAGATSKITRSHSSPEHKPSMFIKKGMRSKRVSFAPTTYWGKSSNNSSRDDNLSAAPTNPIHKRSPPWQHMSKGQEIGRLSLLSVPSSRKSSTIHLSGTSRRNSSFSMFSRFNEDEGAMVVARCIDCKACLEEFDNETISLCIALLATFVHRDPIAAAPLLLEILIAVSRIYSMPLHFWQNESKLWVPGDCSNVAKQFLRCTLHKMAPYGIFTQLFQTPNLDEKLLINIALTLADFNDLSAMDPLCLLFEHLTEKKQLPHDTLMSILTNLSLYMSHLNLEPTSISTSFINYIDIFFKKLVPAMINVNDVTPLMKILSTILKIPNNLIKVLLDSIGKLVAHIVQGFSFNLNDIVELTILASRSLSSPKEKHYLVKVICQELLNALKFKVNLPDENLVKLIQFVCLDLGTSMSRSQIVDDSYNIAIPYMSQYSTADIIRTLNNHNGINDLLEFLCDIHTLTKIKNNTKTLNGHCLHEDTLGGQLKAGVSQIVSIIICRDSNKNVKNYLPWLYHPPSALQQGPKEFIDCVSHIRLLSWVLLGALNHMALSSDNECVTQPIPVDANSNVADYILVILTGFAEKSKASVLHMSSLFHAFMCCQLWTIYLEQISMRLSGSFEVLSDNAQQALSAVLEFWGKVTPGILQLLSHSKVLAEMVNLHFLSLLEALQECNSTVLAKLFPMWSPVLFSYQPKLSGSNQMRLQNCQNAPPPIIYKQINSKQNKVVVKWLSRLQFKISQVELQSSAAAQFYTV